jgi:hypothetical protein
MQSQGLWGGEDVKPEEAIDRISRIKTEIDNWRDSLGEKLSDREVLDIQAYDVATEALEKQIPKELNMFHCQCGMIIDDEWDFCTKCGQAVKRVKP